MDINQIFSFLGSIPWYIWLILFIGFLFVTGDRILFEYEVKFPLQQGLGRGELEFKSLKKKGELIELEFDLETDEPLNSLEIFVNDESVHRLSKDKLSSQIRIKEAYNGVSPKENDQVRVEINGQTRFSGNLYRD
ncbi:MAG: hypothetical protein HKN88_05540 [Gammaproteobacteria bacterium]|nr:hypothetical protein [Gammaproteobacteria bacterium]NNC97517.1 hypothetical protein [Gammaproteobacteria bacterium]NNM14233.1 hypothetical protein [Gammaproteobacteria bacterium]